MSAARPHVHLFLATVALSAHAQTVSSGVGDIDHVRQQVAATPTTATDSTPRLSMLYSWFRLLNNQGVDLSAFEPVRLRLKQGEIARSDYTALATKDLPAIDEGYRVLEKIQTTPTHIPTKTGNPAPGGSMTDWPLFHAHAAQTGYTGDPGPSEGRIAWRFPVGHAWSARPTIENGRVYVASPGISSIAYALDEVTGAVVWKARQYGLNLYGTPRVCSGAVVLPDRIVVREAGSGGETGNARHLVFIDKVTGKLLREEVAGHVDYRRSYAPVAGNVRFVVLPRGYQSIRNYPPAITMLDTVVCKDAAGGRTLWEFRVGDIFGEPVLDGERIYVAAAPGVLFALNGTGSQRVAWQYRATAPLHGTPALGRETVYIGANDGTFTALEKNTGRVRWTFRTEHTEDRAFVFFSTATEQAGRVYVGAADRRVYCLDAATGARVWAAELADWIRSRPVAVGDRVLVAAMDGSVTALDARGQILWQRKLGAHPIFADLVAGPTGVLVAASDLQLHSLDAESGRIRWKHSLLESAEIDGRRVLADTVSGGADFQSSPTVVQGRVYIGGPDHSVHAVDAASGRELWRFETSAQVSATPICVEGRVFFGQQGGDSNFYAVDAVTGRPVWTRPLGWTWVGAGHSNGNLFVGTCEGEIHCVRARDGTVLWTHATNGGVYPNPATDADSVYTGSWDGHVIALDQRTGRVRWAFHLGGSPDSAAPVLANGLVFIQALGRNLHALDVKTGREVWRYDVPLGWRMNATSAARGDTLLASIYIDNNGAPCGATLLAFDLATGKPLWRQPYAGSLTGAAIARDRAFVASTNHPFVSCIDLPGNAEGTTRLHWRTQIGGLVYESCPAIVGRQLFVLAADGYLYSLE